MAKYIKLTPEQKDEIRRLTQFANRRIKAAYKEYRKYDMEVLPSEVTGDIQIREQWHTKNTPLSRSVKFTSLKEYRKHLNYLRSFERMRPTIREYTTTQRTKTLQAVETSLGLNVPKTLGDKLNQLSAPELSRFWNRFASKASKLGIKYSSEQAMLATLTEFFPEDMDNFNSLTRQFME